MTPVLTATPVSVTPEMKHHPLATRSGIEAIVNMLLADRMWRQCSKPQQALLDELCRPAAAKLLATGELSAADLPVAPATVPKRTRDALRRRLLLDADGRLTATAVHSWYYAVGVRSAPSTPGGGEHG